MDSTNDTHTVLMEATYRTLAAQGYEGETMRAVADRADKGRGLLDYHFDDKDDLVYSLLDHLHDRMTASVRDAELENPVDELRRILNTTFQSRTNDGTEWLSDA